MAIVYNGTTIVPDFPITRHKGSRYEDTSDTHIACLWKFNDTIDATYYTAYISGMLAIKSTKDQTVSIGFYFDNSCMIKITDIDLDVTETSSFPSRYSYTIKTGISTMTKLSYPYNSTKPDGIYVSSNYVTFADGYNSSTGRVEHYNDITNCFLITF